MINWVPSAVLPPLASRHLFAWALTSDPLAPAVQFWAAPPLHVDNCTGTPFAVPAAVMHLPRARKVSPAAVHCWLAPLVQVHSWILVPSAVPPPLTSTHLPPGPLIGPAPPPSSLIRTLRNDTSSPVPWFCRAI